MQISVTTNLSELNALLDEIASRLAAKLTEALGPVMQSLATLESEGTQVMATIADIQAAVANETSVEQSVIALLGQLSQELQAAIAANDPAALQAVVDQVNANAANLAAAVTANTPAS